MAERCRLEARGLVLRATPCLLFLQVYYERYKEPARAFKNGKNRMFDYFKQVRAELRHVVWPSREMTIMYTIVVIAISVAVAVYLGMLDYLFSLVIKRFV